MQGGFFISIKFFKMILHQSNFDYEVYNSIEELTTQDAMLVTKAREVTAEAYAPYSNFKVGSAAHLCNGKILSSTNQENAAYPVGICAERVLLSTASSIYPNVAIDTIAISYNNLNGKSNKPISPCGICRQSLVEYQDRMNLAIRVILSGQQGEIYIIKNASNLLPLQFGSNDMK